MSGKQGVGMLGACAWVALATAALIVSGCSATPTDSPRGTVSAPADVPIAGAAGTGVPGLVPTDPGTTSIDPADTTPQVPGDTPPETPGDQVPMDVVPVGPERILTTNIVVPQVPAGGEATVCMTKFLDNETEVKVVEIRAHITPGSHHFIVDRSASDVSIPVLTPCPGLAGTDQSRVLVAETPETTFKLPAGVVFTLRAKQNLTMELHYINYLGKVTDIQGTIDFVLAPEGTEGNLQEAGMIFTGNPVIALLPGTMSTIEFFGVPAATPEVPVYVFAMTSHTHSLGVRSYIERVPTATATNGELLHESLDWAQPPMDQYDPPLVFTGSDGLRLRCDYNNTTPNIVTFGTRFADEMCFMWLYYYPNTGALF